MSHASPNLVFRHLGRCQYEPVWSDMRAFTERRGAATADEIWMLEHPPIFTVGLNGDLQHVLAPGDIPVLKIDRGGQVTYHGPGQLVVYPLLDLKRRRMGVRDLVSALEMAVVKTLAAFDIRASSRADAPGVYVEQRKIASLGLRIRRGCSYHGLAFNIDMDLEPFSRINPCGFKDLAVTSVAELGGPSDMEEILPELEANLRAGLGH